MTTRAFLHALALCLLQAAQAMAAPGARPAQTASSATSGALSDSLGQPYVRIPAGRFEMGTAASRASLLAALPGIEPKRIDELADERPAHMVTISRAFLLGKYEVTVGAFADFVAKSGYVAESIADGSGGFAYSAEHDRNRPEAADAFKGRDPAYSWHDPGFAQTRAHPVTNVSLHDAQAMAAWLSKQEGHTYRLPTEAEWEYSCKAGSNSLFPSGDASESLADVANTFDQAALPHWQRWHDKALKRNDRFAFTAPVGQYRANAFGLHDMVGNVWEWVSDHYSDDHYAQSPSVDPQGPNDGPFVRRGGSWHTWAIYARCGFRNYNTAQSRYPLLGFRLVRELN